MRETLEKALITALQSIDITAESVVVEHPTELMNGDYASGVALRFAKQAGVAPKVLAEKIVGALGAIDGISKIQVAGAGFINFYLAPEVLAASLEKAVTEDMWGSNTIQEGKEMLIEYTSPNLFKPLHIGNLVGNVIGESISRLAQFSGATVRRINYPSDIGLTVAKGVWGLKQAAGDPADIAVLGEAYRKGNEAYENDEKAKAEIEAVNKALYEGTDAELNSLRERGVATSRAHLDELCRKLGTLFDYELYESETAPVGRELVERHPEIFPESEGARVFNGSHTRVFLTSKGLPTYEAKDLGNFALKQKQFPNWQTYLVVTGVEQKEYFKVLYEAIRAVFPDTADKELLHIATGFLTLTTGKMSSRLGNVLTGESLFADLATASKERAVASRAGDIEKLAEEVSVAALKYQVLKQASGKNIVFDKERALSLDGDSGPYLQYTHARAHQIVERARSEGVTISYDRNESNDIARLIHRFPEIVEYACDLREPHIVTNYLTELASTFNSWYAQEQILDGTPAAAHKVALTDAVRRTLTNGLWILGIPTPEKM